MVHQLVLRLERLLLPGALLPVAGVVGDLGSPYVVDGEVGDNLVHAVEYFPAYLPRLRVHPLAGHLLAGHRLPHIPEERAAVAPIHVVGVVVGRGRHVREE